MKNLLLLTTSLVVGFGVAIFTPLGDLASPKRLQAAVESVLPANPFGEKNNPAFASAKSLGDIQSLIGTAITEPGGNILQNKDIVVAAGFIDPESAWAMDFRELGRPDGLTRASLGNDIVATEEMKRGEAGGGNIGQNAPDIELTDELIWHSQASPMELGRLHATVEEIRRENEIIHESLSKTEETHPDYHMSLCVHESNDGLIAFYSFLIKMGETGVTLADTKALEEKLTAEQTETLKHIRSGRTTAEAYRSVLASLAAKTPEEEKIKTVALEYYDSFLLSFDVEETLATHLTTYPDLIAKAIETGEPPYGVSGWVGNFQELGRSRMELQAFRQSITEELAGPNA